jgi:hypothetical protein
MALMSMCGLPVAAPVRLPMSLLLVTQVVLTTLPRTVIGYVTDVPLERTVPFVVVPILSMLMLPLLLTTSGLCVQLLKDMALILPLTTAPVKPEVVACHVEVLHVLEKTPLVDSVVAEPASDQSSDTAPLCVTPFVSSVVAEAVLTKATMASAATAASPWILLSFILLLLCYSSMVLNVSEPPRAGRLTDF